MFSRLFQTTKGRVWTGVAFLGLAMIAGAVVGFMEGRADALGQQSVFDSRNVLWFVGGFAGLLAIVSFAYGALWMKSIDEAAQEAHKWAWYWGGSAGLGVGMVGLIVGMTQASATLTIPSAFTGRTDPAAYATTGALALMALMMIGYTIAWGVWWLRHR